MTDPDQTLLFPQIFTRLQLILAERGFVTLEAGHIDRTKIESKANKYTFVWRKSVEKNREKLLEKIRVLLQRINEHINPSCLLSFHVEIDIHHIKGKA